MAKRTRKNRQTLSVLLIVVCMAVILVGGIRYITTLRENLGNQVVQNVLTVTRQQQQAFDNFIAQDRERLHSYAEFFSRSSFDRPEDIQQQLTLFSEVDAIYSVVCLDEGWFCSNSTDAIRELDKQNIALYSSLALNGAGIRESFIGLFSGNPKFGYYESFTFPNGQRGLIQKSYDRFKVSSDFSLSFYNDQGLAYVVSQDGNILLWSMGELGDHLSGNILDVLTGSHAKQEDMDALMAALGEGEMGSKTFTGDMGSFVYTYVPMEEVEGWFLVSVVPSSVITEEAIHILIDSQVALFLLVAVLAICTVFMVLIWRTHKDMAEKDQEIEYQEQLFDIFSTYLSLNTDDVYLMLDRASIQIEYVSPNMERVLGVPEDQLMAVLKDYTVHYSNGKPLDYTALWALEPGTGTESIKVEWTNPRTGEPGWFRVNVYCTLVQGRQKLVAYISDRTQEQKMQNSLTEALQIARAANEAKSTFLSSVSHDIRTPLNAITGFITLLQEEADNPEMVVEYTQRINAASQHLLGLINDVLDINKIESGSTTLNMSEVNLPEVINEINTIIRPQARAKDQTFDIFVSSLSNENLLGDKLRINQILINLLSNAVKYTEEGGHIEMRIEELPQVVETHSRVRFIIRDDGLGMNEDYQKVIFDPFTREETSSTRNIQGTGLGMAITKSLVDLMGGTIHLDSQPDVGSTFTVELELRIQEKEDDPRFWARYGLMKMIVADDDEDVCKNVVRTMSGTGVVTDYSTSGETAVQMMREAREAGEPYSLILLDWKMPDLDGLETARRIRTNYPEKIPILLFTAYDWGEIEEEALEVGVNHFMPKPFFMSSFKDAIRRVMGNLKTSGEAKDTSIEGLHFLVVDDIEVNRIILVKILSSLGVECDVAGNGQEAVDTFEKSEPGTYDLILMDVQMPVMGGYEATRAIRSSGHPSAKTIPIIAMTANAFVDDVRDAIQSGMNAHVAKPIQLDQLKATIQQVLSGREESPALTE